MSAKLTLIDVKLIMYTTNKTKVTSISQATALKLTKYYDIY